MNKKRQLVIDKQGKLLKPSCSFKVKASNNYLALRNMTGHYYLNGNWRIDFPQQIEMAGKNSREPVLWIRIWIRMFLGLQDPLITSTIRLRIRIWFQILPIKQKYEKKNLDFY
jgi:hypothetical protein